jgi:hypothetical protein
LYGNVFVADAYNNSVIKLSSSGAYSAEFQTSNNYGNALISVAVDVDGNVWVVDNYMYISKFSNNGNLLGTYSICDGDYCLYYNWGIAIDANGNIWINSDNGGVGELDSSGNFIYRLSTSSSNSLGDMTGFARQNFTEYFCSTGYPSPAEPTFPISGSPTTTWTCSGINGGANTTCEAKLPETSQSGIVTINGNKLSDGPLRPDEMYFEDYCSNTLKFQWKYTNSGGYKETRYQFQIDDSSDFSSPVINYDTSTTLSNNSGTTNYSPSVSISGSSGTLSFNTTYYWRVKVYDSNGYDSSWVTGISFSTPTHSYPNPEFTFSPISPYINKSVSFTDNSICYTSSNTAYSCKDGTSSNSVTYTWSFDDQYSGSSTSTTAGNVSHTYTKSGVYNEMSLKICDSVGCCTETDTITVRNPLGIPQWQEISPF